MKKYRAIFFDWDGTAVLSRKAPINEIVKPMKKLLSQNVKLAVISGTTIENIGDGKLHREFTRHEQKNLYYGLGRGAFNYTFQEEGEPQLLCTEKLKKELELKIHRVCFKIHETLLKEYNYETDIVFSRPGYCKIDLMVSSSRGEHLFFQDNELEIVKRSLQDHGITGGLRFLIQMAEETGRQEGLKLSATTDAKYLEVGKTSKSDNVNTILSLLGETYGIQPKDCSFWGDEYIGMEKGLFGSDSYMITEMSKPGDFFDVSEATGERPKQVQVLNGGVEKFLSFLEEQAVLPLK